MFYKEDLVNKTIVYKNEQVHVELYPHRNSRGADGRKIYNFYIHFPFPIKELPPEILNNIENACLDYFLVSWRNPNKCGSIVSVVNEEQCLKKIENIITLIFKTRNS